MYTIPNHVLEHYIVYTSRRNVTGPDMTLSFVSNGNVGLCHEYNKINRSIDRKYTYPYNENPRLEEYVSARDELLTTEK